MAKTEHRYFHVEGPAEHERWIPRWPLIGSLIVVATLMVGLFVLMPLYGRMTGVQDTAIPVSPVHLQHAVWVPVGPIVALPDAKMLAVGQSEENRSVYAEIFNPPAGGGGGGVAPHRLQMYLRIDKNRYQPIERR